MDHRSNYRSGWMCNGLTVGSSDRSSRVDNEYPKVQAQDRQRMIFNKTQDRMVHFLLIVRMLYIGSSTQLMCGRRPITISKKKNKTKQGTHLGFVEPFPDGLHAGRDGGVGKVDFGATATVAKEDVRRRRQHLRHRQITEGGCGSVSKDTVAGSCRRHMDG